MDTPSGTARLFDLYPQDFVSLARIRERLELPSDALVVRLAIRALAKRLADPQHLAGNEPLSMVQAALLLGDGSYR